MKDASDWLIVLSAVIAERTARATRVVSQVRPCDSGKLIGQHNDGDVAVLVHNKFFNPSAETGCLLGSAHHDSAYALHA